jgi:polyisoprenoid-binding protein YceI
MKHFNLFIASFLIYFASFAQETWTVDNGHSNVRFEVGWEDFSIRTGEFKVFEGNLITDSSNDLSNAAFNFKVDPNSIDVIADKLSDQLKGDRFLNAEKFPDILYTSTKIEHISDSTYISKGKLTIHGIEKDQDVSFQVKGHKKGRRGYMLGMQVSLKLNRKDFGLDWGSPRLGETVKIVGHLIYQMRIEETEE